MSVGRAGWVGEGGRAVASSAGLAGATVAPGKTAPVESRTLPVMAVWAEATAGTNSRPKMNPRRTREHRVARMSLSSLGRVHEGRACERTLAPPQAAVNGNCSRQGPGFGRAYPRVHSGLCENTAYRAS